MNPSWEIKVWLWSAGQSQNPGIGWIFREGSFSREAEPLIYIPRKTNACPLKINLGDVFPIEIVRFWGTCQCSGVYILRSEKRKLGHLICDALVASWCMLLLFEVYRSLQMSLKTKQYSRMSSRLLPSVADNVLYLDIFIWLRHNQCFVEFRPSVSLDNNDRTWHAQ